MLSWEDFAHSVSEDWHGPKISIFLESPTIQLRRCAPTLLETFDFRAAPVVTPLINAIETLRVMNRDRVRTVPGNASTKFVSRRWHPVFAEQEVDRRFSELSC